MEADGPATDADAILAELRSIADLLDHAEAAISQARARRLELFKLGQALEPKVTQAALADASRISEPAVTQALRKARERDEVTNGAG